MQKNILFVDDDPGITKMLERLFRPSHYFVITENSGEQALKLMDYIDFNVIVSDQFMPGMGGFIFLKEAHLRQPSATKLMLSGRNEARDYCASLQPDIIQKFVLKPCFDDELIHHINWAFKINKLNNHTQINR